MTRWPAGFSSVGLSYDEVNPCTFLEPTSPHIVSELENVRSSGALSLGLRHLEPIADWVVVEGAGGWFTPLTASYTFADWVVAEQLPVFWWWVYGWGVSTMRC